MAGPDADSDHRIGGYEYMDRLSECSSSLSKNQDQYDSAFLVSGRQNDDNIPGKIGKGDDAKNSVVWHVITYSLTIYSCIVAALLVIDIVGNDGKSALTIVKDSWAIFTPIITLSLGYMFGKNEESKHSS